MVLIVGGAVLLSLFVFAAYVLRHRVKPLEQQERMIAAEFDGRPRGHLELEHWPVPERRTREISQQHGYAEGGRIQRLRSYDRHW